MIDASRFTSVIKKPLRIASRMYSKFRNRAFGDIDQVQTSLHQLGNQLQYATSMIDHLQTQEPNREEKDEKNDTVTFTIEDRLILKSPSPQTALDIFKGTWTSQLPGEYAKHMAGSTPLFEDTRIPMCAALLGGIEGKRVLDLGPLEGGQAYVLEKMGAASVVAVEANSILFLKCLIAKEILNMNRTQFLCGEITEYLKNTKEYFDICVASGILYHMSNPVELLLLLSKSTDRLMIWTHYFDESNLNRNKIQSFQPVTEHEFENEFYNYHRQEYGVGFTTNVFCGGTAQHSNWMSKEGIIKALKNFGFKTITILEDADSVNGPYVLLTATK